MNFLPVTVPFHSKQYFEDIIEIIKNDLERLNIHFHSNQLTIPVYSTFDGSDLRNSKDLMNDLINMQVKKLKN